jgi:hypothetical protein
MKKTYTTDQLFGEIFLDDKRKFTSTEWEEERYIKLEGAEIVDNEGNLFNLLEAKEKNWVEWTEPKQNTNVLSNKEAFKALREGKRVKALEWENKSLELKEGQILIDSKTPFNIMTAKEKEWEIIEECEVHEDESKKLDEIQSMLKQILAQNTNTNTNSKDIKDGRSTESQANTSDMLKDIYGVTTPREIQAQFKEKLENAHNTIDIQKTVCEYIPYCWIGNKKLSTTSSYYSDMRKVIKGLKNENYRETGLNLFLPPQSLYETVQAKVEEHKKEEIRNKNVFDLKKVEETIKRLKKLLLADTIPLTARQTEERERAYIAYSYLTIVTGRRQVEILSTLKITQKKDIWQYCGITKDREDGKCIDAYALDNDFKFLNMILEYVQDFVTIEINETINKKVKKETDSKKAAQLRKELEVLYFSEKEINRKFYGIFSNALKRITNTSLKPSDWRGIYAEILWLKRDTKKENSHIDKRDFKAKVLGHKYDGKLSATEHYDSSWEAI